MTYPEFQSLMARLRACYVARIGDESLWRANQARFFSELAHAFPPEVLVAAFEGAWRQYPKFFPGLGELEAHCRTTQRDLAPKRPAALGVDEPFEFAHTAAGQEARRIALAYVAAIGDVPDPQPAGSEDTREAYRRAAAEASQEPSA